MPNKRGPRADTLKIEGDWEDAVEKALKKPPPKKKPAVKKRKKKKRP